MWLWLIREGLCRWMGQLLSEADRWLCCAPWNRRYGDSRRDMRQRRLDLGLEGSGRLDEVRLSDASRSCDPCVELGRGVTCLGIHRIGKLLGYYRGRLIHSGLWCCWRERDGSHGMLHVGPASNLLGRNIGQRRGLGQPLWRALHGLWTIEVLARLLVGLKRVRWLYGRKALTNQSVTCIGLYSHLDTFRCLDRSLMRNLLFVIICTRPSSFAARLRVSV